MGDINPESLGDFIGMRTLEAKAPGMGMRVVTLSEPLGVPPAERDAYCTEQRGRWGKHARMTVVVRRFFDQPAV
jgi:hypothetical protein